MSRAQRTPKVEGLPPHRRHLPGSSRESLRISSFSTQLRFENYSSNLLDLIRFRMCAVALKIDLPRDTTLPEQVVAAAHTLFEPQTFEKMSKVIEPDSGISCPAQHSPKDLF